ncbi:Uncharacterised protein [Shigella sonnei]|nr:Uncharacterised protein [Shigella sonnei]
MATTKLAANGVPHQFEDLDALDVIHTIRTAHILRQILVDLRIVQVTGTGREIDQATGNVAFDNVFDLRVGHWCQYAIGLQCGMIR